VCNKQAKKQKPEEIARKIEEKTCPFLRDDGYCSRDLIFYYNNIYEGSFTRGVCDWYAHLNRPVPGYRTRTSLALTLLEDILIAKCTYSIHIYIYRRYVVCCVYNLRIGSQWNRIGQSLLYSFFQPIYRVCVSPSR
jgi:hypothetical protein